MSGGFFRGTTADQDTRFSNKHSKLLKSQKFPAELENLVDMTKVKMDVMRPWIAHRVTELLGFEDEVLINFIYGLLEEKVVNGKEIQISLTGFMEKNTGKFMKELWTHLLSAQQNASGVPQQFLDAKEEETRKKQEDTDRITRELKKTKEKEGREHDQEKVKMADDVDAANLDTHPRRNTKFSSKWSTDVKETDERNGSKETARGTRSRSISISSNSRSHSRSRSLSASPKPLRHLVSSEKRSRSLSRRSSTPRLVDSRMGSPSRTPSRGRSPSPPRRRLRSPARRRSRSPVHRRSRSPVRRIRQRPCSPIHQRSRTPTRRRSRTPIRRRSRSPIRRRSRSPIQRRSRSPIRRRSMSRSPIRRRSMSRSPIRRRSVSRSPVRRRSISRSPVRRRLRTPIRRRSRSRSPMRRTPRSPISRRSPFPSQRRPRSPYRNRSQSTSSSLVHSRSPSPARGRSPSPPVRRQYQRPPSTPRHQSPPPARQRTTFLSRQRSPTPKSRSSSPSDGSRDRHRDHEAPRKAIAESRSPAPVRSKSPLSSVSPPVAGRSPRIKSTIPPKRQRESMITKDRFDNVEDEEITFSRVKDDTRENKYPVTDTRDKNKQSLQVDKRNSKNDGIKNKTDETNHEAAKLSKMLPKEERVSSDSASEESDYKRKHKRKDITSSDENSQDSHTERKEAKRRRKEAKKLKKEEKRKRREERRRRKETRRAEKLKLNTHRNVSPSSDIDKRRDTRDESALSDQKKLEIELREKALESLRAKKGVAR